MTSDSRRDGLLRVDKPVGPTSHDIVAVARRTLGIRKVGHTGTLDPFASGLLLLCLGPSTRLAEYLSDLPKEYSARARLGVRTSTADREGEVLATSDEWKSLDAGRIDSALQGFLGEIDQVPPAYSAKKVGGERAYRRARRGEDVALAEVPVSVHEIELGNVDLPFIDFTVRCSAGTYVRAIARDLGEELGVGASLTDLRRTAIGPFGVEGAVSLEEIGEEGIARGAWIAPLEAVAHLPLLQDPPESALARLRSGQALDLSELRSQLGSSASSGLRLTEGEAGEVDGDVAVSAAGRLVAIAVREGDLLRPRKVFPLE